MIHLNYRSYKLVRGDDIIEIRLPDFLPDRIIARKFDGEVLTESNGNWALVGNEGELSFCPHPWKESVEFWAWIKDHRK